MQVKKQHRRKTEKVANLVIFGQTICSAKFGSWTEPLEGFYLAIVCDKHMILLLGDMRKEAFKKTSATSVPITPLLLQKGSMFMGRNTKNFMQVKRLQWKFRGNHTILVDGIPVEVFWDVHSWLFGTSPGSAVFMFRTSLSAEKLWVSQPLCDPTLLHWSQSQRFRDSQSHQLGFSLILYAWKQE
ncbi:uncharacterized protein LOC141586978 [Silene latifolia]|uniref:uncharacterized protein LOC141586978 n=1 Tax=Silene latifolia TaxID=37657 RepID=UPI003D78019D